MGYNKGNWFFTVETNTYNFGFGAAINWEDGILFELELPFIYFLIEYNKQN